ncbi:TPA: 23S rRNA (adenine(2503)-C(2))-methyltransferase RlmN [Patescibacteria group bacterium]|nr:MAG: putative dual-specificity RNA methyltransferase RlmN [Parcubacteria group bacterium GW2011_GWF2_40_10]KKR48016.1 MAG: putative dual-specificity RNA methyltransferase RlmN [Parcubacteria group bacterium GW2011_GWA2_40_143]KKR60496.1 MAG: putative dual-specificity RNA methyltransferase RlmN [Parcubacteria group bacterium GW2011_GWC2_40_31]KKR74687.1 MAG: putative dual-specificity RNA methyltransferase RlmN [Parcubacteria group bacterium GW2011_GWB2_40_8]KKR76147.1 MAG: putative dual-speci
MNIKDIENFLAENGHKPYRLKEIKKAVFVDLATSWQDIKFLPKDLRDSLDEKFAFSCLKNIKTLESKKGDSVKVVFETSDGLKIETVLMKHLATGSEQVVGRNTVCISSQAGCAMACGFCATGKAGYKRNLASEEIVEQVLFFARYLKSENHQGESLISRTPLDGRIDGRNAIDNIVFMGMGEPFLNYDNVMEAARILNDKDGFNLGIRHISISTCGITPAIKKFAEEKLQINLAVSLHGANDEIRTKLMPINKVYPIAALMTAIDNYIKKTNRKVMFEYLLIDGVNDSREDAYELAKLMKGHLYHVNLIKYHDTGGTYKPSLKAKRDVFFDTLKKLGVSVTQRVSFGEDILAACGQLAGE